MNNEIKSNIDCLKSHKFNFDYCLDELLNNFDYLQKQLEAYENIRKEIVKYIDKHKEKLHHYFDEPDWNYLLSCNPDELLNILNKVGEDNE